MNFWQCFRETWHEGVALAAGYVVVAGWRALGLPSVEQAVVSTGRWLAAMLA